MSACLDIVALSDDEGHPAAPVPAQVPAPDLERAVAVGWRKRRLPASSDQTKHCHSRRLQLVVSQRCKCKLSQCRAPWKDDPAAFEKLLQLRLTVQQLPKLDADEEATWVHLATLLLAQNEEPYFLILQR